MCDWFCREKWYYMAIVLDLDIFPGAMRSKLDRWNIATDYGSHRGAHTYEILSN